MKVEKIKINRIIKKILWPNSYWGLMFYGTWLGVFFFHLYSYDRTVENFLKLFAICFIAYSPFYILGENDGDGFLDNYKWFLRAKSIINQNKIIQWVLGIGYVIMMFWALDKFALERL